MTGYALVGLVVMIVSEAATLARIEPFWSWNTPIAWTGFILFADGIVFRRRGHSWITSASREFGSGCSRPSSVCALDKTPRA